VNDAENHAGNGLEIAPNIPRCDDIYEALVNAHSGLSNEDSTNPMKTAQS